MIFLSLRLIINLKNKYIVNHYYFIIVFVNFINTYKGERTHQHRRGQNNSLASSHGDLVEEIPSDFLSESSKLRHSIYY